MLIGNRYLMENYNIHVPEVKTHDQASTLLYLSANDQVLMVLSPLLRP